MKKVFLILLFISPFFGLSALDLTILGPAGAVLRMPDGVELKIDATGKYVIHELEPGDVVSFTTDIPGRYPADYAIEMGQLSKTFRISPKPTGVTAAELKFTDDGFCPSFGFELYFVPEDAYVSFDLYQSFLAPAPMLTGENYSDTRYILPMLGTGLYILPFDSLVRINLGLALGCMFGSNLPSPAFAAEASAGLEIEPFEHFILFGEINPRLLSPVGPGWGDYSGIFGSGRASGVYALGRWGLSGFPATNFGLKIKY